MSEEMEVSPQGDTELEERNAEIYRLKCSGMSQVALARKFNLSQPTISWIINREKNKQTYHKDVAEVREEMVAQLQDLRSKAQEIVDEPPVEKLVVGKGGATLGKDYSNRLSGIDAVLKVQRRTADLLGADAPVKIDQTTREVGYTIEGVDMSEVTGEPSE